MRRKISSFYRLGQCEIKMPSQEWLHTTRQTIESIPPIKTQLGNIHAFLDNDEAGRKAIATAAAAGILTQAEYNADVCNGRQNSELEDFLTEYLYADVIYQHFGVQLISKFMGSNKKQRSEHVRDNFQNNRKVWTPAMKSEVKSIVSCAAASLGLDSLNPHRRGPIDALIVWLEERLAKV